MRAEEKELIDTVRERATLHPTGDLADFVNEFRTRHGKGLAAVILYGSRLWSQTSSASSLLDFFLVAEDYDRVHPKRFDRLLNRVLPPSTYQATVAEERAKYNVVSLEHLERETSERARDLFLAGRLSKRIGLLWARDEATERRVLSLVLAAMRRVVPVALSRLPEAFELDEFLKEVLAVSYAAEIRVEADSKVDKLFAVEESFYREVYGRLLREHAAQNGSPLAQRESGRWRQDTAWLERERARTDALLRRSRLRMYARWFKYMATLDGWTDMLLEKIERTKGIRLELTPLQRKYPYLFGWPHFFRLLRQGLVK